jgi:cytochrome c-type biogenesis protein CcmE
VGFTEQKVYIVKTEVPVGNWSDSTEPTTRVFVVYRGQDSAPYSNGAQVVQMGRMEGLGLWESRNMILGHSWENYRTVLGMI